MTRRSSLSKGDGDDDDDDDDNDDMVMCVNSVNFVLLLGCCCRCFPPGRCLFLCVLREHARSEQRTRASLCSHKLATT